MFVSLCPLIYKSSSFLTRHLCCALQSTSKRLLPLPTTQNSHQTHGALRAVRDAPSVERRWPALPARTPTEPQAAEHAESAWPDTLPPPCALGVLPRPHGLAHSPASCSPLTLDRLRRTAVIAADEGLHDIDIDRTDLSDPALNADLDKPKTLLPHSDVEPSSMMLQPVGESEPSRKNSAAV